MKMKIEEPKAPAGSVARRKQLAREIQQVQKEIDETTELTSRSRLHKRYSKLMDEAATFYNDEPQTNKPQ